VCDTLAEGSNAAVLECIIVLTICGSIEGCCGQCRNCGTTGDCDLYIGLRILPPLARKVISTEENAGMMRRAMT
jgi:hypothetical protein